MLLASLPDGAVVWGHKLTQVERADGGGFRLAFTIRWCRDESRAGAVTVSGDGCRADCEKGLCARAIPLPRSPRHGETP